jgi:hypothetical protein
MPMIVLKGGISSITMQVIRSEMAQAIVRTQNAATT